MKTTNLFNSSLLGIINTVLIAILAWIVLMGTNFISSLIFSDHTMELMAVNAMQATQHYIEPFSMVHSWLNSLTSGLVSTAPVPTAAVSHGDFDYLLKPIGAPSHWLQGNGSVYLALTVLVITKTVVLLAFFSCLAFLLMLAFFDGLIARSLRRFQGVRESALLYHQSKKIAGLVFYVSEFIFLVIPFAFSPELFLIPVMILTSFLVWIAVKQFKKYL